MATTKILVPVDGSDSSMRALKYAAKAHDATLLVLNVQPAIPSSSLVSRRMIADHQQRAATEALAPVRATIKRSRLDVKILTIIGEPATSIVNTATKHSCSAIVMGSRGHGRIAGLVLGSVAAKVIHLASCPVTVVK